MVQYNATLLLIPHKSTCKSTIHSILASLVNKTPRYLNTFTRSDEANHLQRAEKEFRGTQTGLSPPPGCDLIAYPCVFVIMEICIHTLMQIIFFTRTTHLFSNLDRLRYSVALNYCNKRLFVMLLIISASYAKVLYTDC